MIRSVDLLIFASVDGVISRGVPGNVLDHEVPGPPVRREGIYDLPVITPNTFSHYLYKQAGCYGGLKVVKTNLGNKIAYSLVDYLTSIWGLFAGVNSNDSMAFKSAASFECFTGNPDQGLDVVSRTGRGGPMLSKSYGRDEYRGYCRISVERLQFINLSNDLWHSMAKSGGGVSKKKIQEILKGLKEVLAVLGQEYPDLSPDCELGEWVKTYSREKLVHRGIKFNSDALEAMIRKFISWIKEVGVIKSSGTFYTTDVIADYNPTSENRIKLGEYSASTGEYYDYYEKVEK